MDAVVVATTAVIVIDDAIMWSPALVLRRCLLLFSGLVGDCWHGKNGVEVLVSRLGNGIIGVSRLGDGVVGVAGRSCWFGFAVAVVVVSSNKGSDSAAALVLRANVVVDAVAATMMQVMVNRSQCHPCHA